MSLWVMDRRTRREHMLSAALSITDDLLHRNILLLRPSRPGEFHPEPLTDPDVILSHHPARVIARRLPPSAEPSGSSRYDPVGPSSTAMTHPLRSTGITPLQHYYGAVRPSPAHRYFRPRDWSRLCLFPWHRRPGSHVPYKLPIGIVDPQRMKRGPADKVVSF